jgi:hypothetical protein
VAGAGCGMSAQHTQGPWSACDVGDYTDFDGRSRVILGDDMRIAVVHVSCDETSANADLIAAAPELLEALQAVCDEQDGNEGHASAEAYDKARAAIAKATGGEA